MIIRRPGQKLLYPPGYTITQQASSAVAGWWLGAYAAYDFKGAATYAAAKLDLTGNLRHCTDGSAYPTHTPGVGCTFNGSTQYLITPITPVNNQQWTMGIKFSGVTPAAAVICGCYPGTFPVFYIIPANSGNHFYGNGNQQLPTNNVTYGSMIVSGNLGYLDGSLDTPTPISPAAGTFVGNIYIGCVNGGVASPALYLACTVSSFFVVNSTFSPAEIAVISAAMP